MYSGTNQAGIRVENSLRKLHTLLPQKMGFPKAASKQHGFLLQASNMVSGSIFPAQPNFYPLFMIYAKQ